MIWFIYAASGATGQVTGQTILICRCGKSPLSTCNSPHNCTLCPLYKSPTKLHSSSSLQNIKTLYFFLFSIPVSLDVLMTENFCCFGVFFLTKIGLHNFTYSIISIYPYKKKHRITYWSSSKAQLVFMLLYPIVCPFFGKFFFRSIIAILSSFIIWHEPYTLPISLWEGSFLCCHHLPTPQQLPHHICPIQILAQCYTVSGWTCII